MSGIRPARPIAADFLHAERFERCLARLCDRFGDGTCTLASRGPIV
jgi:hypothetical protein